MPQGKALSSTVNAPSGKVPGSPPATPSYGFDTAEYDTLNRADAVDFIRASENPAEVINYERSKDGGRKTVLQEFEGDS